MLISFIQNEPIAFLFAFICLSIVCLTCIVLLRQFATKLEKCKQQQLSLEQTLQLERLTVVKLESKCEAQEKRTQALLDAHQEKIADMNAAEQRLQTQFENLANKIFDEKQQRYTQQAKTNIESVLAPFKNQLDAFKQQIADQHIREGQERASLKTEILGLKALNQKITEEAAALTNALKGDNKQQGNWGEVVLERILKESGLREGHEFETQVNIASEQGKRQLPDVVVHLPNDKDVVIDSKVSLTAYERYYNCKDEVEKASYLKQHVTSIKSHVKGLGSKNYQSLKGLKTLDYVLLFIPIESAFMLAIEEEPD